MCSGFINLGERQRDGERGLRVGEEPLSKVSTTWKNKMQLQIVDC